MLAQITEVQAGVAAGAGRARGRVASGRGGVSRSLRGALALVAGLCAAALQAPACASSGANAAEQARWQAAARASHIVRDDWGIAHVHGHSDADAVFAMIYAQAEDDFARIETNYLTALGRLAEAQGESALYQDLRMRLFIDAAELQRLYAGSPAWLRRLMVAWADGLNAYLASHPQVHPRVLTHFEPWMALSFSEGSIGGDIERVDLGPLQALYGTPGDVALLPAGPDPLAEPTGSNGIAIAPGNTQGGHALLLINPHTSFYFRSELQVSSDAGLNAYGAATWGQFFLYQGFNEHLGWMHTSSGVDNVDFFRETIVRKPAGLFYRYGQELRPVRTRTLRLSYRTASGTLAERRFTVYGTHHGPVIRADAGQWVSIALMQRPVAALSQSFLLTRARDYAGFLKVMALQANSSNNTIYADAAGNIAYLHPQFVPRRNDRFDYRDPVDGADPATDWHGLHPLNELPQVLNPPNGWIANTNNWPYSAAGPYSPLRASYPRYMDTAGENPRGLHAARLLSDQHALSADALNGLAFDPYLPAFAQIVPGLVQAFDALPPEAPERAMLAPAIEILRAWDYRWSADSVATTLAVLWGDALWTEDEEDAAQGRVSVMEQIGAHTSAQRKLAVLAQVCARLQADFGDWRVAWGQMNRYQRITGAVTQDFSDAAPSSPIAFTSGRWGSLASFGAHRYPGTNRYYGTSGNSFVAIVEFGPRVVARAVSIGGESGDPASPHFADQLDRYARGALRPVYFYPEDLAGHTERAYAPRWQGY